MALLTETFGFSSGFVGYYRKRLIDFGLCRSFLIVSIPAAIAGALVSHLIDPGLIRFAYGFLMLILAVVLLRGHEVPVEEMYGEDMFSDDDGHLGGELNKETDHGRPNGKRKTEASDGTAYYYPFYKAQTFPTGAGGFLTGMLSAGIGEVAMPQLVKAGKVPVPVAAGTSILIVIVTVLSASFTHVATLIGEGGADAVPWNLVAYTVPGVILGGQIGPRLQGKVSSHLMERAIGIIFGLIGVAMMFTVYQQLVS